LDPHYREGWLERKLTYPRTYDRDKSKTPKDKLRMPRFDLEPGEVHALSTFVLGLVACDVDRARMVPSTEQASVERGERALRRKGCLACHVLEPPRVTYEEDSGGVVTLAAEVLPLSSEEPLPPPMESLAVFWEEVEAVEDYYEEPVTELGLRLLAVEPDHGLPGDVVVVPRERLCGVTPGLGGDFVRHVTEYYALGTLVANPEHDPDDPESDPYWRWSLGYDEGLGNLIEDVDGELRCYAEETYDKLRWTFAPPVLIDAGRRLQTDWLYAFLEDPPAIRQQMRVRMPSFDFDPGEAEAIADCLASRARREWPTRYAKTLRLALGRGPRVDLAASEASHRWGTGEALVAACRTWPTLGLVTGDGGGLSLEELSRATAGALSVEVLEAIEAGDPAQTRAHFARLQAFGDARGLSMAGPIKVGYEHVERRTPSHLARRGDFRAIGHAMALEGVDCFQCHVDGPTRPALPISWAPPLSNAPARLREDWVAEWLWSPKFKYPGTAMPDNFGADVPQYQAQYPDSTNNQQIQAVMDWLFNLDRPESD